MAMTLHVSFRNCGVLVLFVLVSGIIGSTLGALGALFQCPEAGRATKGGPGGATLKVKSVFLIDSGINTSESPKQIVKLMQALLFGTSFPPSSSVHSGPSIRATGPPMRMLGWESV